jgi:hypothetical protein
MAEASTDLERLVVRSEADARNILEPNREATAETAWQHKSSERSETYAYTNLEVCNASK